MIVGGLIVVVGASGFDSWYCVHWCLGFGGFGYCVVLWLLCLLPFCWLYYCSFDYEVRCCLMCWFRWLCGVAALFWFRFCLVCCLRCGCCLLGWCIRCWLVCFRVILYNCWLLLLIGFVLFAIGGC